MLRGVTLVSEVSSVGDADEVSAAAVRLRLREPADHTLPGYVWKGRRGSSTLSLPSLVSLFSREMQ